MNKKDEIKEILKKNNGILYVKEIEEKYIHRQYLKELENDGYVEKVIKGLYVEKGKELSEFFIIGEQYKSGMYSHNTALYFYGLTDRTPLKVDITFPNNIRLNNDLINSHYIKKEFYELGATTLELNDRTTIRIYDLERTICDIIRDRNKTDTQILNTALKEYMKLKNKNINLLYKYAKRLKIDKILKQYMEVL